MNWTTTNVSGVDKEMAAQAAVAALSQPVMMTGESGVVIGQTAYNLLLAAFQRLPALPRNRALVVVPSPLPQPSQEPS